MTLFNEKKVAVNIRILKLENEETIENRDSS